MNIYIIEFIIYLIFFLFSVEIILQVLVRWLKKNFQWLITKEDEFPINNQNEIDQFIKKNFSESTGWDRKVNSEGFEYLNGIKTFFKISSNGYRENENNLENAKIAVFGDSYAFCRYVNNNETWENFLEKNTGIITKNYGVGNFGIDQAIMKYFNCNIDKSTKLIILAFVPETIARIHSYWKHYLEFGNKFGFKPKYSLEKNKLIKIPNVLDQNSTIETLKNKTSFIKKNDIFYKKKFMPLMFKFPYLLTYFKFFNRNNTIFSNLLMFKILKKINNKKAKKFYNNAYSKIVKDNIKDSYKMYEDIKYTQLFEILINDFKEKLLSKNRKLLLLIMPQLYDVKNAKNKKLSYQVFFEKIKKNFNILDLTDDFKNFPDYENLFLEDKYGGHLSTKGNKFVADILDNKVKKTLENI